MNSKQRLIAFIGAMLITFGITGLNLEDPAFQENIKEYIAIIGGGILMIIFFNSYRKSRS